MLRCRNSIVIILVPGMCLFFSSILFSHSWLMFLFLLLSSYLHVAPVSTYFFMILGSLSRTAAAHLLDTMYQQECSPHSLSDHMLLPEWWNSKWTVAVILPICHSQVVVFILFFRIHKSTVSFYPCSIWIQLTCLLQSHKLVVTWVFFSLFSLEKTIP